MLWNVIQFELQYRKGRPATYIYFFILFLMGFLAIAVEDFTVGGGTGQVKENAPRAIAFMMVIMTALPGFLMSSAIMGTPVLRDFEHKTSTLFFTTPISKGTYLWGRFWGAMIVLLFVFSGVLLGLMLGAAMPWLDEDKMLPYNAWHFIQPFLVFVVPNILITGTLFYMGGALSRNLLFVYVQGAMLLVLYLITGDQLNDLDNQRIAAILDPVGINLINLVSRYWTVAEQNTQVFSMTGLVLINRLLWIGISVGVMILTHYVFNFDIVKRGFLRRKRKETEQASLPKLIATEVHLQQGSKMELQRILHLANLYFKEVIRSIPFLVIASFGIVMTFINGWSFGSMYGTDSYPTTYQVLGVISGFNLFFIILIVFYSGELVWRERDIKMNQIFDALPLPNLSSLLSKFLAFAAIHICLLFILMLTGITIQAVQGYFKFELGVYIGNLFSENLAFLILFTLLAFFLQIIANHKYLGHALVVLFFIVTLVMTQVGLEHNLFRFASGSLGQYSDMNTYGHYVPPFSWYQLYWMAFGVILFAVSVSFSVRGVDTMLKKRLQLAKLRFARPLMILAASGLAIFIGSGAYIYYNTNILNTYKNSDEQIDLRVAYEKELKQYESAHQPKIVETYVEVDLYPQKRNFTAKGYYILKNRTNDPIETVMIQEPANLDNHTDLLDFTYLDSIGGQGVELEKNWEEFGFSLFNLPRPLMPDDSIKMDFIQRYETVGFKESGSNTSIVFNGTFFNNTYFPSIGYNRNLEVGSDSERKDHDLPEKERMRERDDPVGQSITLVGDDGDYIRFETIMSTDPDQIAISPGYLQKEWEENGRRYFHYKMDRPMMNFYSFLSAKYEVMREAWTSPQGESINLEIYYHKGHEFNLDRMMEAMKHSLTYYGTHFSPYQYRQMRIMEFPRYATFAQSFANTVPFSEGIGFIMDIGEDDVDIAYYITAHEMAHQWWGHQVCEARVKGNAMLSETMSQYSALMVMKEKYPPEKMQEFLKYELDSYLNGRATEQKKEMPLSLVEGQGYIHYRKGSLIMYALQDYISEDSVNAALHRYVTDWAWRQDRFATTDILLEYFRAVTPDSLQYLITDMFETITLFENRTMDGNYSEQGNGEYLVNLDISSIKYRADSLGNETEIPISDWIDVGVFGETDEGKDTLLYLKKHHFTSNENSLSITVNQEPTRAGIDPINKLIDRNPKDNTRDLKKK